MNLKKKLVTLLTSLTLMTQATACTTSTTEFDTIRGKRNLSDYSDFLSDNGINYRKCTVFADGEIIYIYERNYTKYIVTENTTLEDITNEYNIDEAEIIIFNSIKEYGNYEYERSVNVYTINTHAFTLSELDNNSVYHYYVVQPGDTVESIANMYGVDEIIIRQKNNIQEEPEVDSIVKIPTSRNNKIH